MTLHPFASKNEKDKVLQKCFRGLLLSWVWYKLLLLALINVSSRSERLTQEIRLPERVADQKQDALDTNRKQGRHKK